MLFQQKIVAIDDEPQVLASIGLALEKYYDVVCFTRGDEAIQYFKKPNCINVVLLDIYMKDMDGISVLQEIRKINKDIAVIIITALGTKEIAVQALRHGADDFIDKPFSVSELREKIRMLLQERLLYYKSEDRNIEDIKHFIRRNFRDVSLKDIADEMCLSAKYISRLFKARNKSTFRQYKVAVKIEKAQELLRNSHHTVYQIAEILGYQNAESFMRFFKRCTRMTPTEYREKHRKKK